MFSMDRTVRYSECGVTGDLTPTGIVNYFQDCSTAQSEELGVGVVHMKERGKAWILTSWQIIVHRRPQLGEDVVVSTWPTGFQGFFGTRNYLIEDAEKNVIAQANSIWILMDTNTGRPTKVREEDMAAYTLGEPLEMEYAPRKIESADCQVAGDAFAIRLCHLDTNNHVNNGKYVEMATEYATEIAFAKQIRVEYKQAAIYGDIIVPKLAKEKDRTVVELESPEGKVYAVIEITGEKEV